MHKKQRSALLPSPPVRQGRLIVLPLLASAAEGVSTAQKRVVSSASQPSQSTSSPAGRTGRAPALWCRPRKGSAAGVALRLVHPSWCCSEPASWQAGALPCGWRSPWCQQEGAAAAGALCCRRPPTGRECEGGGLRVRDVEQHGGPPGGGCRHCDPCAHIVGVAHRLAAAGGRAREARGWLR